MANDAESEPEGVVAPGVTLEALATLLCEGDQRGLGCGRASGARVWWWGGGGGGGNAARNR